MAQISDIKERLLEDSSKIIELLEAFDFCHISHRNNEIRFARNEQGGMNINLRLQNNNWLNVSDFARGFKGDIFSYIAQERNVTFREVLLQVKKILNLDDDWSPTRKRMLFGGLYANIGKNYKPELKTYDESILEQYPKHGSLRFLQDHINLKTQIKFGIRYSIESQRILIPIRNIYGDLCGIKGRRNYETDSEEDPKYLYALPCQKTLLLYGAHENYQHLMNADVIYIFESEKATMACDSYGYNNAVSIMGNILSSEQAKILLSFNAKEYCFMLDEGLDLQVTYDNAKLLRSYTAMREFKVTYFNWENSLSVGPKESPTDNGKENFEYIIENEIEELEVEDEI